MDQQMRFVADSCRLTVACELLAPSAVKAGGKSFAKLAGCGRAVAAALGLLGGDCYSEVADFAAAYEPFDRNSDR